MKILNCISIKNDGHLTIISMITFAGRITNTLSKSNGLELQNSVVNAYPNINSGRMHKTQIYIQSTTSVGTNILLT